MTLSKNKLYWIGGTILLALLAKKGYDMLTETKLTLSSFIPTWEGFSATPYWDSKQWSWGYGTAAGFDPNHRPTGTITRAKALADAIAYINNDYNYLKGFLKVPLNANQWAAWLSFSYNLGKGNADNLVANINAQNWAALENQWKLYINADGQPSQALIDRRAAEWNLFTS